MNEIMRQLLTIQANQALMMQILSSLLSGESRSELYEQADKMLEFLIKAIDDLDGLDA